MHICVSWLPYTNADVTLHPKPMTAILKCIRGQRQEVAREECTRNRTRMLLQFTSSIRYLLPYPASLYSKLLFFFLQMVFKKKMVGVISKSCPSFRLAVVFYQRLLNIEHASKRKEIIKGRNVMKNGFVDKQ